jgi:hypothetical protein
MTVTTLPYRGPAMTPERVPDAFVSPHLETPIDTSIIDPETGQEYYADDGRLRLFDEDGRLVEAISEPSGVAEQHSTPTAEVLQPGRHRQARPPLWRRIGSALFGRKTPPVEDVVKQPLPQRTHTRHRPIRPVDLASAPEPDYPPPSVTQGLRLDFKNASVAAETPVAPAPVRAEQPAAQTEAQQFAPNTVTTNTLVGLSEAERLDLAYDSVMFKLAQALGMRPGTKATLDTLRSRDDARRAAQDLLAEYRIKIANGTAHPAAATEMTALIYMLPLTYREAELVNA